MHAIRPLKLAALAIICASAGVFFASPAAAAPVSTTTSIILPASVDAPLDAQYGPTGPTFTITLNFTIVVQGGVVRFVINGNVAGRQLAITLFSDPTNLGTFTADANGNVASTFNTAELALGQHHLQVVATDTGETQNASFTVIAAQASGFGNGGGGTAAGGGGLAFTGANAVVPLTTLGVVLLLGGGAAVVAGRRRRQGDVA